MNRLSARPVQARARADGPFQLPTERGDSSIPSARTLGHSRALARDRPDGVESVQNRVVLGAGHIFHAPLRPPKVRLVLQPEIVTCLVKEPGRGPADEQTKAATVSPVWAGGLIVADVW